MSDDRVRTSPSRLLHPLAIAAVVALVNAAKPAVVDDTAYLLFARHIAAHPGDPYGFELFWYREPEPAMTILAPPVVPYWLAAGTRLFGEHLFLLKLWLFPFPLAFAYATRSLLARFAPGVDNRFLPAIVLGPGVLPFLNVMLDVPALALQASAVALFVRATDRGNSIRMTIAAGACAGLAVQTKYSVLLIPVVIGWYGLVTRRLLAAAVAVVTAMLVFVGWELFLVRTYGTSHFVFHVFDFAPGPGGTSVWHKMAAVLGEKAVLVSPLLAHLGATTWWVGPLGFGLFGVGRRVDPRLLITPLVLFVGLAVVPGNWLALVGGTYPTDDRVTVNGVVFTFLGGMALATGILAAVALTIRTSGRLRTSPTARFLAGWLVVELAGYFVLTPFPAGRRVLGVSFVLIMVVGCFWARVRRLPGRPTVAAGLPAAAIAGGFLVAAVDTLDAYPEKELPEAAAAAARERGWPGTGWFVGHWGFQYYCDRLGMRPLLPGRSDLRPGDWLVVPVPPDGNPFSRPYDGKVRFAWDESAVVREAEFVWTDPLAARTVPNLYGGRVPVLSRKHPRLRVALYRVVKPWRPTAAPPA